MNSYNKSYIEKLAKENGFLRDNLEKVIRLAEILRYFNQSNILKKSLALKGGTAINMTVFQMPRLSIDIDLDFTNNCCRNEMLEARERINRDIHAFMSNEGYILKPGSKNPHTLDSWIFGYTNAVSAYYCVSMRCWLNGRKVGKGGFVEEGVMEI